jgi:hypothetical protein
VTNTDRNLKIIEILQRQTQERLSWPPEKLKEYLHKIHGPDVRELEGKEAEQMLLTLKLVGHYTDTNNQRTHTYFYYHNGKEYRVTYGLGDDPLVEEVLPYD